MRLRLLISLQKMGEDSVGGTESGTDGFEMFGDEAALPCKVSKPQIKIKTIKKKYRSLVN